MEEKYNFKEELIMSWLTEDQKKILDSLDSCESPIEKIMFFELSKRALDFNGDGRTYAFSGQNAVMTINPQKQILCGRYSYRLDFEVLLEDLKNDIVHKFAVECDGHDFHEKTKQQASNDRKRERELSVKGYHVIRFTGTEIVNNSTECVEDVFRIIRRRVGSYRAALRGEIKSV